VISKNKQSSVTNDRDVSAKITLYVETKNYKTGICNRYCIPGDISQMKMMECTSLDRLCGLVVRVLGYRSGGPGSIPGTSRKKKSRGSGTGSTQPREYN
jgi:hypothetical protein